MRVADRRIHATPLSSPSFTLCPNSHSKLCLTNSVQSLEPNLSGTCTAYFVYFARLPYLCCDVLVGGSEERLPAFRIREGITAVQFRFRA